MMIATKQNKTKKKHEIHFFKTSRGQKNFKLCQSKVVIKSLHALHCFPEFFFSVFLVFFHFGVEKNFNSEEG